MSKSQDKDVERYVFEQMPAKVKKALAVAQHELYSGPSGSGMGYVKASKIVEDWWNENMRDDLVVDDGGNVSTQREFEKWVEKTALERYKEALKELKAEGVDDNEERHTEYGYVTELKYQAMQSADYETQALNESGTLYDARQVRNLILGRDWS